ncbi:MAG TPA: hypothetical protein VFQ91_28005 [Bryobacteraceae bacterium]|nr:hypothetical protein [Bryobacteraceae bacterium]
MPANRSSAAWLEKTAADIFNGRVVPFCNEHNVDIEHLLTDNNREFCGRELNHPFEISLALNQIAHRHSKARSPETNDFVERFHRTDLDVYVNFYNRERALSGHPRWACAPTSG